MKMPAVLIALVINANAFAGYLCQGPKGTALELFKIYKLSETNLETSLDGGLDSTFEEDKNTIGYVYNNGCDNEMYFRINKMVPQYEPNAFNLKMDYLTEEQLLHDTEVICKKTEL